MRYALASVISSLALTVAAPALAQQATAAPDAPPMPAQDPAPPAAPGHWKSDPKLFTGLYVAAAGGYDVQGNDIGSQLTFDRNGDGRFGDVVTTAAGANAFSTGFCNGRARGATLTANGGCQNDRDQGSYYGRVGFDVQTGAMSGGSLVVGVLGEFGRTHIKDLVTGFSTTPASYVMTRRVDWEASGRVRAGYARGIGLFYATGGVGYLRLTHSFETTNTANSFSVGRDDRHKFGYVVGGGVEVHLTRQVSIGLEYTFHDYKDNGYQIRVTQGSAPATNPFVLAPNTAGTTIARTDERFRWNSLRGVVGFHF